MAHIKLMDKGEKTEYIETLSEVANARSEKDADSWRKYFMQKEYVDMGGGVVVEFDRSHIQNEFYYSDEYDSPLGNTDESRKNYFVYYNMRRSFEDHGMTEWLEDCKKRDEGDYVVPYHLDKPFMAISDTNPRHVYLVFYQRRDDYRWEKGFTKHVLTNVELDELADIVDGMRAKFAKRLEAYWKRYSHKICSHAYWADR